ncbi:MAG: grasp-with-spasm system ATP-grasp peptide maturase [Flavobacteriales bacterium]|nr:grasp-with-spasm system ATP-grasp peptide maturase [Flavobacteriales bacterium]
MMILIISNRSEATTNQVIDWLHYYGVDFIRINEDTPIRDVLVLMDNGRTDVSIKIDERTVPLREVSAVWYRRGWFQVSHSYDLSNLPELLKASVTAQLTGDLRTLSGFVSKLLFSNAINTPADNNLNKLSVLQTAASLGLSVPATIVTSCKTDLIDFRSRHGRIVTKNMSAGVFIEHNGTMLQGFTKEVTDREMAMLPDYFFPMLFQAMVRKVFEVRIFYLNDRLWSSAIFSQSSTKTKVDFRNYDVNRPNRTPPYILPRGVESKLRRLMNLLRLTSGSIDIMVDENDNHVFLEVNPVGQFWQVSYPCNYNLEDEVARAMC